MRDYPHVYRGVLTLPEPDPDGRTEIPVKQIGKGMFSRAYLTKTGTPYVYPKTTEMDGGDYSKRQLYELSRDGDHSPYLPRLVEVGCDDDNACFYRMPYYRAPLRKKDSAKAWAQYRMLYTCWVEARVEVFRGKSTQQCIFSGHQIMDYVVECAEEWGALPGLVRALDPLRGAASNYGSDYSFEFAPRNLATTDAGHLILLDCVFSLEVVEKQRRAEERRAQARRGW